MAGGFVMLPSYYVALRPLPDDQRLAMYDAIWDYVFAGTLPEGLSPVLNGYFLLLQPNIDASARRYNASVSNGRKGGRPRKESCDANEKTREKTSAKTQKKPIEKRQETMKRKRRRRWIQRRRNLPP